MQWVPSHVGVHGNEQADLDAGCGAKAAKRAMIEYRVVTNVWADLGLQEMLDCYNSDSNVSGGSGLCDSHSDSDVLLEWCGSKRQKVSGSSSEPISP